MITTIRGNVKKKNSIFKDIIQIEVDPLPPTLIEILFWENPLTGFFLLVKGAVCNGFSISGVLVTLGH